LSLTGLLGHLYGAKGAGTGLLMEPAAAALMLVSALTLLYLQSGRGPLAVVVADSTGGVIARRLLPASILVPIALGWLRMVAEKSGWLMPSLGLLVHVLASIAVMAVIVWRSATVLTRTSPQKQGSGEQSQYTETSYQKLLDVISQPVFAFNSDGEVTYLNPAARQLFSIGLGEEIGLRIQTLVGQRAWENIFAPQLLGIHEHSKLLGIPIRQEGLPDFRIDVQSVHLYRSPGVFELLSVVRSAGLVEAQAPSLKCLGEALEAEQRRLPLRATRLS
jgi:PAS domain-containing protein